MIQSASTPRTLTILIVEDDNSIQDVLQDLLSPSHSCHIAGSAEVAREMLSQYQVDLVFVDISLPGESGMELAAFIRHEWPQMAIIFTTALSDEHYMAGAVRLNALAYVTKPFDIQTIAELVGYVSIETEDRTLRQAPTVRRNEVVEQLT